MPRLSAPDYRATLDVLGEAGAVAGPLPFPAPVLDALRRLVPCDVVAFHEHTAPDSPAVVFVGEPQGEMTPEIRAANRRWAHQDPLRPAEGARKYSDVLSRREQHRLRLYQEADRPLGIEHMMRLWVDASRGARIEFDRAHSDFTERDRAVLDLLLPYLRRSYERVASRRVPARAAGPGDRLTPREREILSHVAEGLTNAEVAAALRISPQTVRKHLENCYAKLDAHTRTGAVAAAFGLQADPRE